MYPCFQKLCKSKTSESAVGQNIPIWWIKIPHPAASVAAAAQGKKYIVPGVRWYDTNGTLISAHAGGITKDVETGKFFWFGENKVQGQVEGQSLFVSKKKFPRNILIQIQAVV
jgi:hypothetical protein